VVADHTKFGWSGVHRIATIDSMDMIITDSEIEQKWVQWFKTIGIEYKCC
jgi:DeoR/GlpR family transcriptional regulator of sugar metabolism